MSFRRWYWWCCLCCCFVIMPTRAATSVVLDPAQEVYDLGLYLSYLEDPAGQQAIEQIRLRSDWLSNSTRSFSRGLTRSAYWLKLELENNSSHEQEYWLLISYPMLDQISVYSFNQQQQLGFWQAGDSLAYRQRWFDNRQFIFPLKLPANSKSQLYLRVQTSGAMQVPLQLWRPQAFTQQDPYEFALQLFYLGAMLAMAVYNLMVFLFLREKAYALYTLYVVSFTLFVATYTGIGYQILWPDSKLIQAIGVVLFGHLAGTFGFLFALDFLNVRKNSIFLARLLYGFVTFNIGLVVLVWWLPFRIILPISLIGGALTAAVLFLSGLVMWRRGSKPARYFTIAWAAMELGVVLLELDKSGWLPHLPVFSQAAQIGATLEVFLLSLALADRFNYERQVQAQLKAALLEQETQARAANERALVVQQRANEALEACVNQRTAELQQALGELSSSHEQLKNFSTLDGLTGVRNRHYFDEKLDDECRRAVREQTELSILMIDIDFFKKVNDHYGHLGGDECLKCVSDQFKQSVRRPADVVARYGGEEFSFILPNTPLVGALQVAEQLRQKIELSPVPYDGVEIRVTISIGVAQWDRKQARNQLVNAADKALYDAKLAGRNCVVAANSLLG